MKNNIIFLTLSLLLSGNIPAFCTVRYVTNNGAGTMDGSDWSNAAPGNSLQSIINSSSPSDEVWVACGTYLPTTTTNRTISFSMRNGVAVYGGFTGNENFLSERDLSCGSCSVLSGEIGAGGLSDNSYKVVYNQSLDSTAVLDGFVIEAGNDDRSPTSNGDGLGGGIYNHGYGIGGYCHPTVRNIIFSNNYAGFGGGSFNNGYNGGDAEPTYYNCIFYQNHAYIEAGGMDSYGVGGNASPRIINSVFYQNTSATNVGAMYAWGGNTGGNSNPVLINCTFIDNQAFNGYAGAFISSNLDEDGINSSGTSIVTLQNCVVWNNSATAAGPQFYVRGTGAQVVATYSDIDTTGQLAPHIISGTGTGNISVNPMFTDISNARGADNCWLTTDDGLIPVATSPLTDAGNLTNAPSQDILNLIRTGNPDMGSYEYHQPSIVESTNNYSQKISIYPNPVSDHLIIRSGHSAENKIEIINVLGAVICSGFFDEEKIIDFTLFHPGIYFLRINDDQVYKIIKR